MNLISLWVVASFYSYSAAFNFDRKRSEASQFLHVPFKQGFLCPCTVCGKCVKEHRYPYFQFNVKKEK